MLLQLENVSKTYRSGTREVRAVDDISLGLEKGEFVAVQGPSGCGKSTLLLMAGGLLEPDSGRIEIAGENPYQMSADSRARFRAENVGFVFQQFHLVPYLTVLENVLSASLATRLPTARTRAEELLEHFGLSHRLHHVPAELSTGERQRTALARALLNQPKLILADEPTGNLDEDNAQIVLHYLAEAKQNAAVLMVTHESAALQQTDRVYHIRAGRLQDSTASAAEPSVRTES